MSVSLFKHCWKWEMFSVTLHSLLSRYGAFLVCHWCSVFFYVIPREMALCLCIRNLVQYLISIAWTDFSSVSPNNGLFASVKMACSCRNIQKIEANDQQMRAQFSRLVVKAIRIVEFSPRLFSIMALSRGEMCGLIPHNKKGNWAEV